MEYLYCVHSVTLAALVDIYYASICYFMLCNGFRHSRFSLTLPYSSRDSDILEKCGPDAVQYLSFQRYLLVYLSIITVLSISVILPINFMGELGKYNRVPTKPWDVLNLLA